MEFSNKSSIPHSLAVTKAAKAPVTPSVVGGGLAPLSSPAKPIQGITPSAGLNLLSFSSATAGSYYLVCGVPGHLQAGMYDKLQIANVSAPSIKVGK
jgi:hypothetical protein